VRYGKGFPAFFTFWDREMGISVDPRALLSANYKVDYDEINLFHGKLVPSEKVGLLDLNYDSTHRWDIESETRAHVTMTSAERRSTRAPSSW